MVGVIAVDRTSGGSGPALDDMERASQRDEASRTQVSSARSVHVPGEIEISGGRDEEMTGVSCNNDRRPVACSGICHPGPPLERATLALSAEVWDASDRIEAALGAPRGS